MSTKQQILEMVDLVPECDLSILLEVVKKFIPVGVDDLATAEDLEAHKAALAEYAAGETVGHNSINWD